MGWGGQAMMLSRRVWLCATPIMPNCTALPGNTCE
jgi:hypothetical protein